jgi:tetratricopeptide (TPR) repeat protein
LNSAAVKLIARNALASGTFLTPLLILTVAAAGLSDVAIAAAPADDSASMAQGHHLFAAGDYTGAVASFQSAAATNPSDLEAFYWLGRSYYEVPDYDNAVTQAQKSVALDPKNSLYHEWLGRAYGGKADRDRSFFTARKVKGEFEEAVRLNPSNIEARRDLEDYCISAPGIVGGSRDEARAQVDAIAALDPAEGHLAMAEFQRDALKKPDQAEAEYRAALDAKPKRAEAYFEVANFFIGLNKAAGLDAAVNGAADLAGNDTRMQYYRGVLAVISGTDPVHAEQYLKSYIASTPNRSDWPSHAAAREWLGRLYESQGKTASAVEQYRASLQLDPNRQAIKERLKSLEKQLQ